MLVLVLADFYLWSSLKKQVFNYRNWLRVVIIAVYWFPLLLLLVIMVGSLIKPVLLWNDAIRTYMVGTVMIFYTAKLIPILFLILADVIRGIQKLIYLSNREKRKEIIISGYDNNEITRNKFLQYTGFVTGGLILGTMFTGMLKWAYEFKIHKEKITFKSLPKKFNNLKIVQISDLHLGSWASKKPLQRAVDIINELEPDLIFFTGDLVNYATKEAYGFEQVLSQLKAKLGIYAVLGNHDYGDYVAWPSKQAKKDNMIDLFKFYKSLGWNLLNNENQILDSTDGSIAIVGVENWGASNRFPKYGDLDKAFKGAEDADVKILLSHDPSHWEKVVIPGNYNIDLSLSGHTHGFQFGIETKEMKWSPAKYMYKQWAGLYEDDEKLGRYIYVNRGLGSIGYPGRIGILPEITLIELAS
ncbi:MAG: metallophosphoesterase [Lentimicrobiaceae bacterium]|jgi:uncharacterized protein|nr:metallophosphoesterase [Lentimicrobiaceae bacterium]MCP4911150.1 metallophosphoesterase [Bacteroidota bacterium]MBT3453659.1 metallophosphoesterase [Lentimicrobiaceae bacterium]MBT3818256.1 metallophosphoesterase [Lentimicrobiaceae bacterium]MBT4061802.1 metallophosphoesterase [Lentimicrobiaceae bacterium]